MTEADRGLVHRKLTLMARNLEDLGAIAACQRRTRAVSGRALHLEHDVTHAPVDAARRASSKSPTAAWINPPRTETTLTIVPAGTGRAGSWERAQGTRWGLRAVGTRHYFAVQSTLPSTAERMI